MAFEDRFVRWQWALALIHLSAAAVVGGIVWSGSDWRVPVYMLYNVWQSGDGGSCTADNPCTIQPHRKELAHALSVGSVVATYSMFSGAHHAVLGAWEWARPGAAVAMLRAGVNPVRHADYALSASLMLMTNAVLFVAPPDVQSLVNWFALQFLVVVCGYGSEVAWAAGHRAHAFWIFAGAVLPYALAWGATWYGFVVASQHDATLKNDPPVFVWILLVWLCGSFFLFPIAHCAKLLKDPDVLDSARFESWYSFLSLFSKLPLLCVFASGVVGRSANSVRLAGAQPQSDAGTEDETTATLAVFGVTVLACIVLGLVLALDLVYFVDGIYAKLCGPAARTPAAEKLIKT